MTNVAVIGYGYWGPNLVRNFWECESTELAAVCDRDETRLAQVHTRYPVVKTTTGLQEILEDDQVDAVAIATPVSTHFRLAMKCLEAGKHVLVEKPMTDSSEKCRTLIEMATKRERLLMVDHTFPYTSAVRKIKELLDDGELGEVLYYDSTRVNLGLFQADVNVIWDLAVHDFSIVDFLLSDRPEAVSATGTSHFAGQPEDMAFITLFFPGNRIGHIHVNWLSPVKVRQTMIGGNKKMIVYDDIEPTEKIKVYSKGVSLEADPYSIYQKRIGYRTGDVLSPNLPAKEEALSVLVKHFALCCEGQDKPITDAESGARIVRMLEAATESMTKRGEAVSLLG